MIHLIALHTTLCRDSTVKSITVRVQYSFKSLSLSSYLTSYFFCDYHHHPKHSQCCVLVPQSRFTHHWQDLVMTNQPSPCLRSRYFKFNLASFNSFKLFHCLILLYSCLWVSLDLGFPRWLLYDFPNAASSDHGWHLRTFQLSTMVGQVLGMMMMMMMMMMMPQHAEAH